MDFIGYSHNDIMDVSDYEGNIETFKEATKNVYMSYGDFKRFLDNLEENEKETLLQETVYNSIFKSNIKDEKVMGYIDTSINDMWLRL